MIFLETFSWWYTNGWRVFIKKIQNSFVNIADFFSMSSLLRTLFKPFRQISAENAHENSSADLRFHMFIERLISRIVGFFSRFILLIIGSIVIILDGTLSCCLIILWPFIPLLPAVGIILTIMKVTI